MGTVVAMQQPETKDEKLRRRKTEINVALWARVATMIERGEHGQVHVEINVTPEGTVGRSYIVTPNKEVV